MAATISLGAPQPWPPPPQPQPLPNSNKNYFFLQPPPLVQQQYPFINPNDDDSSSSSSSSSDDSSRSISPLMAALIAVLIAAFLCLFYYTVISRYCRRRRATRHTRRRVLRSLDRVDPMVHDPARPDTGLDEAYIRQITVFKYIRGDGLVEATECAVCLAEFKEGESLRLMPNCEHAFHLSCIDTWLATHSSCPLCRSGMNPLPARGIDVSFAGVNNNNNNNNNGSVSVAALRVERSGDDVVVVREVESRGQVVVEVVEDETEKETR